MSDPPVANRRTSHSPPLQRELEEAQRIILSRPSIPIRHRLIFSLLLCFVLCGLFGLVALTRIRQVRGQLDLLEALEMLYSRSLRVQLLERQEGSSVEALRDARARVEEAEALLAADAGQRRSPSEAEAYSKLLSKLADYRNLLGRLESATGGEGRSREMAEAQALEAEIAFRGRELVHRERGSVARLLRSSEMLFGTMLAILLGFFLLITFFFTRALMDPIRRFQAYTRRIAQGDFSLIRPARGYRDEFSELALAVNQMLAEFQTNQEKLIQAGKLTAMGTITSGIAHELNNPLNNVAITTEALMEDFKDLSDEEKWRLLQDIYFETERAGEIVKSLLDFTRDERPDLVPVDILEVIEATRRIAQNEMVLNNVRFELRAPPGLPPVRGAANHLRQVFLNLFLNAVQAMPGGGPLTVEVMAEKGSNRLCVEVRDAGIGISPEHLPHVFDPFFTTKEPGKGTGLGLSICYSIIQKHGGTIEVTSERGRGTTFHLCLPLANGEKTGAEGPRLDLGPAEA